MAKLQLRQLPRILSLVLTLSATLRLSQATAAIAQTDTGRITGVVRDPAAAVVAGATVTAKNERTGDERTTTTA